MIQTSHIARRRLSYSVIAATSLLISARFASAAVDPAVLAFRAAATAANIEDISGLTRTLAAGFASGTIKANSKNVKSAAVYMADSIIAKTTNAAENRVDNKADEIAEGAAELINGLAGNAKIAAKIAKSKPLIIQVMKGALNTAKQTAELFGTPVFRDVAGSTALTIANKASFDATQAKLQKALSKKSVQKKIAGKTNQISIQAGIAAGFGGDNVRYEDGGISPVVDPETDTRPA